MAAYAWAGILFLAARTGVQVPGLGVSKTMDGAEAGRLRVPFDAVGNGKAEP
jgi:hypothetical protein